MPEMKFLQNKTEFDFKFKNSEMYSTYNILLHSIEYIKSQYFFIPITFILFIKNLERNFKPLIFCFIL